MLVSESFPDMFKYLTSEAGNNRNPDTAAMCEPFHDVYQTPEQLTVAASPDAPSVETTSQPDGKFVISYTDFIDQAAQKDFDQACSEMDVICLPGKDIAELTAKGVDVIVNASNRWAALGDFSQRREALSKGIPFFELNAEVSEEEVYNLSAENDIITTSLKFMFKNMQDQGSMAYFNFGDSDYIQLILESVLKDYPRINAIKMEASYDKNPFTDNAIQKIIAENPKLGAIWSSDPSNDLFWGAVDKANSHIPFIECPAREDMLTA